MEKTKGSILGGVTELEFSQNLNCVNTVLSYLCLIAQSSSIYTMFDVAYM